MTFFILLFGIYLYYLEVDILLERIFKLQSHGTDTRTEFIAGLTTFMTMAYILAVNPAILGASGMDSGAIFTATAVASAVASCFMAGLANLPFALSAGLGLNAFFAYTVCGVMGYSWQQALTAVFVEGLIFIVLSLSNIREAIFNAIPNTLKVAVSVGIGLFICFIGLQSSHIVVDSPATLVSIFSLKQAVATGTIHSAGVYVVLAFLGVLLMSWLMYKNVRGGILIGMLLLWGLGILLELCGIYVPAPENGYFSMIPGAIISMPASLAPTAFKLDFSFVQTMDFVVVMCAFLFVDLFDTLGTLIGCATKGKMLDEKGELPGIKGALMSDSLGTVLGSLLGTSTITTFVESSAGIAEGGRTGLTAVVTAGLFLLALFFSPVFLSIPSFATAAALITVGFLMLQQVTNINWQDNLLEAVPAYICVFSMPFMYSISEGISLGVISYVVLHMAAGKFDKLSPLMYALAVLFLLKYILL